MGIWNGDEHHDAIMRCIGFFASAAAGLVLLRAHLMLVVVGSIAAVYFAEMWMQGEADHSG